MLKCTHGRRVGSHYPDDSNSESKRNTGTLSARCHHFYKLCSQEVHITAYKMSVRFPLSPCFPRYRYVRNQLSFFLSERHNAQNQRKDAVSVHGSPGVFDL